MNPFGIVALGVGVVYIVKSGIAQGLIDIVQAALGTLSSGSPEVKIGPGGGQQSVTAPPAYSKTPRLGP